VAVRAGARTTVSHSLAVLARLPTLVPDAMVARAEARRSTDTPVVPVLAASVLLLRDSVSGLETYLLHRHSRMPFAASMVVFPGGRVDASDHGGSDPLRTCAVRETHEETGVSLSGDDLHDWAHWITPEVEPRRYDTRFFVAALPAGQHARDISGETDHAEWSAPADALVAADRGELALMPPTRSMLLELADLTTVAEVVAAAQGRVVQPVLPRLTRTGAGWTYSYPSPA
jgi:8-oxo-dGTP pyrophosphatase MutT (NUDIX family)